MEISEREKKGRKSKKRTVSEGTEAKTPLSTIFAVRCGNFFSSKAKRVGNGRLRRFYETKFF